MGYEEELRYKVSIKKSYKVFLTIGSSASFLCALLSGITLFTMCDSTSDCFAILFLVLFFIFVGMATLFPIVKRVEVYKGKVIYIDLFHKKTYRLSDIRESREKEEAFYHDTGDGIPTQSYDRVTAFYDTDGKRAFHFGLAYENMELLTKDVNNVQKSLTGNNRK